MYALKILRKIEDTNLEDLLAEAQHEIVMALEIMKIQSKYFMKLIAFQINGEDNVENLVCCMLYEYGLCNLDSYVKIKNI